MQEQVSCERSGTSSFKSHLQPALLHSFFTRLFLELPLWAGFCAAGEVARRHSIPSPAPLLLFCCCGNYYFSLLANSPHLDTTHLELASAP